MRGLIKLVALAIAAAVLPPAPAVAQQRERFLVAPDQVVAIKAGRLYEPKAGRLLPSQVILIRGDRIAEVGPDVAIPEGARVIDLSRSTVMPGMIDAHVHANVGFTATATPTERALWALASVQRDLRAGFTTVKDMDSRGGFNTVDLRDLIEEGLVLGPRMQVVGQSLNARNNRILRDQGRSRYYSGRSEDKDINGPWLARAAVREARSHGADSIKIYMTGDFVGRTHLWKADGSFLVTYSLTLEETAAIVDEAHRHGMKVACHDYDGRGATDPCLIAGADELNHMLLLDDAGARMMREKGLIYVPTIDDLVSLEKEDLEESRGRGSRLALAEKSFRTARKAGVEIAFGSGATTPPDGKAPHGVQAAQFRWLIKWGMTPAEALRTSYIGAARAMNYDMEKQVGTIEKGKYADIIAVAGDPLQDITEMERVRFVMKGGLVVRGDGAAVEE